MHGRAAKHRPAYEAKKIERRGIIASALMIITVASLVGPGLRGSGGGLHHGSKGLEGRNNLPTIIPRPSDIFARTQPTTHSQHTHNHTSTGTDLTTETTRTTVDPGGRRRSMEPQPAVSRIRPRQVAYWPRHGRRGGRGPLTGKRWNWTHRAQAKWMGTPQSATTQKRPTEPTPRKVEGRLSCSCLEPAERRPATPPTPLRTTHPHHITLHAHDPINGTGTDIKGPRPGTTPDTGNKGETEWGQESDRGTGEN